MHVPVFLTRQVLVKIVLATTLLLSGIVTSVTKDALLVQSGELVGKGVAETEVALACTDGVSVGVCVTVGVSVTVSVAVTTILAVVVGVLVSVRVCGAQAEVNKIIKRKIARNIFFMETSCDFYPSKRLFHYIQNVV